MKSSIIDFYSLVYDAGICQFQLKNYPLALKHFGELCVGIKDFCKEFLDAETYENLVKKEAFVPVESSKDINQCFEKAIEIFSAVYGPDHYFVKNYVNLRGGVGRRIG
jgi:hypothetical protein